MPKMDKNLLSHWKGPSTLTITEEWKVEKKRWGNSKTLWGWQDPDATFYSFHHVLPLFSLFYLNSFYFPFIFPTAANTDFIPANVMKCVCVCVRMCACTWLQWRVSHVNVWKPCCDLWTTGWPARSSQTVGHLVWVEISQPGCKTVCVCVREWETCRATSETTSIGHLCT